MIDTKPLLAFHGDAQLREKFLAEMQRHRDTDMLMQGMIGENTAAGWRGCHVACGLHTMEKISGAEVDSYYSHGLWETLIGIPEWVARVCDRIFEGLVVDEAREFPMAFSHAVRCGAELNRIKPEFMLRICRRVRPHVENSARDLVPILDIAEQAWQEYASTGYDKAPWTRRAYVSPRTLTQYTSHSDIADVLMWLLYAPENETEYVLVRAPCMALTALCYLERSSGAPSWQWARDMLLELVAAAE